MITVVAMLWGDWGTPCQAEYVNRLFRGFQEHLGAEHRFVCVTDIPGLHLHPGVEVRSPGLPNWEGNLRKFWAYKPDNGLQGRVLLVDLDSHVVGDLRDITSYDGPWCGIQPFNPDRAARDTHSGGGLVSFEAGTLGHAWEAVSGDPAGWAARTEGGKERLANKALFSERDHWQTRFPGQVISYKRHVRSEGRVPAGARFVCFHGDPRPHTLREGWFPPFDTDAGAAA